MTLLVGRGTLPMISDAGLVNFGALGPLTYRISLARRLVLVHNVPITRPASRGSCLMLRDFYAAFRANFWVNGKNELETG